MAGNLRHCRTAWEALSIIVSPIGRVDYDCHNAQAFIRSLVIPSSLFHVPFLGSEPAV